MTFKEWIKDMDIKPYTDAETLAELAWDFQQIEIDSLKRILEKKK